MVLAPTMPRPRTSPPQNYQVRALQRGLAILRGFTAREPALTLGEVSARHGIPKATALRLLECLVGEGFLSYDRDRGRYALGPGALEVGSAYLASSSLERSAAPFLRRLADQTGQTANLGVLDGREVLHISVSEPDRPLRYHSTVGSRDLVHCTALGKALAAHAAPERVEDILAAGLPRRTPATITDPAAFRAELARVRRDGYAEDCEEGTPGLRCLAAPIHGPDGRVVAALSVSGTAPEFEGVARDRILRHLRDAAEGISDRLGAPRPTTTKNSAVDIPLSHPARAAGAARSNYA